MRGRGRQTERDGRDRSGPALWRPANPTVRSALAEGLRVTVLTTQNTSWAERSRMQWSLPDGAGRHHLSLLGAINGTAGWTGRMLVIHYSDDGDEVVGFSLQRPEDL